MIVSAFEGRIRCVEPDLKKLERADAVEKSLREAKGITDVRINRQTGSLLVYYDHTVATLRTVRKLIDSKLKVAGIQKNVNGLSRPQARRNVKIGMLGTITGSILFLVLSSEQWHFRIGAAFLTLLSVHLYQNRRRIFK